MELNLYRPKGSLFKLRDIEIYEVKDSEDRLLACNLEFSVDFSTYQKIEREGLFHNRVGLRYALNDRAFLEDSDVTIQISLKSALVQNINIEEKSNWDLSAYLTNLENLDPENEIFLTGNWFILSAFQEQAIEPVGYKTFWFYAPPGLLTEEVFSNREILNAYFENLKATSSSDLTSSFQDILDSIQDLSLQDATEIYQALQDDNLETDSGVPLDSVSNLLTDTLDLLDDLSGAIDFQELADNAQPTTDKAPSSKADSAGSPAESPQRTLSKRQRLSQSPLWQFQRDYFETHAIAAIEQNASLEIDANTTAQAIEQAHLVAAFLQDCTAVTKRHKTDFAVFDRTQPIYILEVGAGSGRFAYRFLQCLQSLLAESSLKKLNVIYVLTDFVPQNLTFWQQHPALQPFLEQGCLEVARFDWQHPGPIALQRLGKTLTAESLVNPPIVIANNVFSCLPQDAFYIEAGRLHHDLVSLTLPEAADPKRGETLLQLSFRYDAIPIEVARSNIPATLQQYSQSCDRSHILWPTVALQGLEYLRTLANNRLMLISSDVAYCHEVALQGREEPTPSINGYLTFPANYHALADWTQRQGGQALQPESATPGFSTQVLLFGEHPTHFRETKASYRRSSRLSAGGAGFLLDSWVGDNLDALSLPQLLAYLQQHHWDAEVFLTCFSTLLPLLDAASPALRHDVIQGVEKTWQGYYPINEETDLAFYLGMTLYALADYSRAIEHFARSRQRHGDDPSTLYNLAMSHYRLGQRTKAMAYLEETLALNPEFEAAQTLMQELQ